MNVAALKLVQKYTEKGLADCKHALELAGGDPLEAIRASIDKATLIRLRGDIISRSIVPHTLNGRPTAEEERILAFIVSGPASKN
jgi:hypothetical protein